MAFDNALLEALTASLAGQVGSYFDGIDAAAPRPIAQFNASTKNIVYVIYSPAGLPLSIGSLTDGPRKRGRQGPPDDVAAIRSAVPGALYCSVDVGNGDLAENLVRLMRQLFNMVLPFNAGAAPRAKGAAKGAATGKRRGRPPGSGKKRGRPAKNASASGVKRGPGRPPKNAGADASAAPKRRGRPPGSGKKRGRPAKAASVTGVKRGPGRPPKNAGADASAAPKRRGRPPGTGKKRGRPFGSKNKPAATE